LITSYQTSGSGQQNTMPRSRYRFIVLSFLAIIIMLIFGAVVSSFAIIRCAPPWYTDIKYNTLTFHKFAIKNTSNNIVMIGDSALLMGIIPEIVAQETGHSMINLGLYGNSGLQGYYLMIDHYLRYNTKPEYIIFYHAATTPYHFDEHKYEKTYTVAKYGSIKDILSGANPNLNDLINSAWRISWKSLKFISRRYETNEMCQKEIIELTATKGFQKNFFPEPLSNSYIFDSKQEKTFDTTFISDFRTRYKSYGIRVLCCLAPMPKGDVSFDYFKKKYETVVDNTLEQYPNGYFTDKAHLTLSGAEYNSKRFALFLKQRIQTDETR